MSDKGLAKAKKRIEEKRKELGVEPEPVAEEVVVTPAVTPEEPAVEPAAEPVAEPVVEPAPEPVVDPSVTPDPETTAETPSPEPTPEVEPAPEVTPNPIQVENDRLQALVDEQRKKLNDRDGRHGAELQSQRHENVLLFEQLQQARAEREAAAAEPADYDDPISKEKLDAWIARVPKRLRDKYEDEYWQDAARVSIIADQVRVSETSNTDPRVDAHEKSIQDMASDRWLTDADRLATEAGAEGFIAANQSDEGWAQRLQQPVFPGSAMTTKEFLEQPGTQPRAAADMYVQYKGVTTETVAPPATPPPPGPTRPTLREQVTSRPSATPGRKDTPQTMTQAEYERRRHDKAYANGDPAKQEAWNEAKRFKSEGRVSG